VGTSHLDPRDHESRASNSDEAPFSISRTSETVRNGAILAKGSTLSERLLRTDAVVGGWHFDLLQGLPSQKVLFNYRPLEYLLIAYGYIDSSEARPIPIAEQRELVSKCRANSHVTVLQPCFESGGLLMVSFPNFKAIQEHLKLAAGASPLPPFVVVESTKSLAAIGLKRSELNIAAMIEHTSIPMVEDKNGKRPGCMIRDSGGRYWVEAQLEKSLKTLAAAPEPATRRPPITPIKPALELLPDPKPEGHFVNKHLVLDEIRRLGSAVKGVNSANLGSSLAQRTQSALSGWHSPFVAAVVREFKGEEGFRELISVIYARFVSSAAPTFQISRTKALCHGLTRAAEKLGHREWAEQFEASVASELKRKPTFRRSKKSS